MTFCCSEFHFAGRFFHHSFLNLLFSSLQCCSLYFRWGGTLGYSTIPSAEFIIPSLSLQHILSFIDCIQQSPNGAMVRTCPLCWADNVNWEFSNGWVVGTFLRNRHEIHLPLFVWVTEVWIHPQPSGSSKSPWLIFSTVIIPPSQSGMSACNKHYIPKQADVSYPNLNHSLYHSFSTCPFFWKQVTGGYGRQQPTLLGTTPSHQHSTDTSKQVSLKGANDEQRRLKAR